MIILALDIGTKRIGVAKSDELGMLAHAVGFIDRGTDDAWLAQVNAMVRDYRVDTIIVGMPVNMDGTSGPASEAMTVLVERMRSGVSVPLETWDERLTTKEASRYLQASSCSGSKKRKKIDALAAQIMLQSYLDMHR